VYAGRGSDLIKEDLSHQETRAAVDLIIDRTAGLFERGKVKKCLRWIITPTALTSTSGCCVRIPEGG